MDIPYLPGRPPEKAPPLARFLPPIPAGVGRAWLQARYPPGTWLLDPFGASPALVIELARAGCRVLVAANNPILRFLIEMQATPPQRSELLAALEILASARKGDAQTGERLEPHLLSLYATPCAQCETEIPAEAFLWEKDALESDAPAPFARVYRCPHCGDEGERPAVQADAALAARFPSAGLHHARALERVLSLHDPDREHVEEALRMYLPRTVYALFTLVNKLDGLALLPRQRSLLAALLLAAFDRTNILWQLPTARTRPKQLTIPPRFIERNVWRALEAAVDAWAWPETRATPLFHLSFPPPSHWERGSGEGAIYLFEGRLKDLAAALPSEVAAVVAALPRPNQAFWMLSALWAGWLWGPEAVGPFRAVLHRRRYDWAWHTEALHAALRRLSARLAPGSSFFALLSEAEPGFLNAALVAADLAGFELAGLALRTGEELAQITWQARDSAKAIRASHTRREEIVYQSALAHLRARGEPAPYLALQAAALSELARQNMLVPPAAAPGEAYADVRDALERALTGEESGFTRLGGSPHALDVGKWWLAEVDQAGAPLSDRVETALAAYVREHPGETVVRIDAAMCAAFPGLLTPEAELVLACLESYGEQDADGRWSLRAQDREERRRADVEEMRGLLAGLGERLGFGVTSEEEVVWLGMEGEVARFGIQVTAGIGKMAGEPSTAPQAYLVLPGGRAGLLLYKIRHDPRLAGSGWQFLKFRHVRQLAASAAVTRETWQEQFELDPLTVESAQMRLL